jgi:HSP20 family molecular chaperone IbpA
MNFFDRMNLFGNLKFPTDFPNNFMEFWEQEFWGQSTDNSSELNLDIPGIRKEDLTVELDGYYLKVSGQTGNRSINHRWYLSGGRPESVEAKLTDGVLVVHLKYKSEGSSGAVKVQVK